MKDPLVIRLNHPRVNAVFTSDWHLTEHAPGRRTGSYADDILAKVRFTSDLAHSVNGVGLCGGDVTHIKDPNSSANSFSLEARTSKAIQTYPLQKVFGAIGNHDIWADRMETLPKQLLGSLIASGVYHDLSDQHVIFENEDASVRVLVEAYPYADDEVTLARVLAAPARPVDVTHRVAIMHQYGHPGGAGDLFGHRTIGYNELAEVDYDLMLWGHDHSREETVTVGNVTHVRLGSLARCALAHDDVTRPVSAAVLSFTLEGIKYQEREIPVKALNLAFVAADKAVEKVRVQDDMTGFFAALDVAATTVTSSDPRTVVYQLAGDDTATADAVCQLCHI